MRNHLFSDLAGITAYACGVKGCRAVEALRLSGALWRFGLRRRRRARPIAGWRHWRHPWWRRALRVNLLERHVWFYHQRWRVRIGQIDQRAAAQAEIPAGGLVIAVGKAEGILPDH